MALRPEKVQVLSVLRMLVLDLGFEWLNLNTRMRRNHTIDMLTLGTMIQERPYSPTFILKLVTPPRFLE